MATDPQILKATRLEDIELQITSVSNAIKALTYDDILEYHIESGQGRQVVKKRQLPELNNLLKSLYREQEIIYNDLNGSGRNFIDV